MHRIGPYQEIQEAARCISVDIEDLEFVRDGLWYLPREHSEKPEVQKLLSVYKQYAYSDVIKWAETENMRIEYDDAVEIVVFSGSISAAKDQVVIGIITQPSFEPRTRTSNGQIQTLGSSLVDQHRHSCLAEEAPLVSTPPDILNPEFNDPSPRKQSSPRVEDIPTVSTHPDAVKPKSSECPPQKRRKLKQHPSGPRGAETDKRPDSSLLGQQTQVKIVRDFSNQPFQMGGIICLDEHDTLYVQRGYIVVVWIRYRAVKPSRMSEG